MKTNTTNTTKNAVIFSACHELTRALVSESPADYRTTFSACVKLYHSDIGSFIRVLKSFEISAKAIAMAENDRFDIFRAMAENDTAKINALVNFAFYYGLKRADAFRTEKEIREDTVSDNYSPKAVDALMKNDVEDVKNDIVVYLLERADKPEFIALENIYKLCKAGNCCINKHIHKENTRLVHTAFSLDYVKNDDTNSGDAYDKRAELSDTREYYADIDKVDCIDFIVSRLPKIHRDTARRFMARYYSNHGKSGITIDKIAKDMKVSVRTLKSIRAEIKAIGYETVLYRDK